jgi:hypothetical protein
MVAKLLRTKDQITLSTKFKISLITPTYKRTKYLIKNYNILKKIFPKKFEWIIITETNDHLTNSLVKKFDKNFVKHISGNFKNNDLAFNYGVMKASGNLICIYGDDDFLTKNTIKFLEINYSPNIDWYIGYAKYVDENNIEIRKIISFIKKLFLNNYSHNLLYLINFIMTPSVFFSKTKFLKLNKLNFKMRHATDYLLWLQFSKISRPKVIKKNLSLVTFTKKTKTGSFDYKRYFEIHKNIQKFSKNYFLRFLQFFLILLIVIYNFTTKKILKFYD